MNEFCPSCDANVGFGTVVVIGCPLCGYKPDDYNDDNLELPTDEEIEEMLRQQRVWQRAERNAQRAAQRRRRKAADAAKTKKRLKRKKG